MALWLLLLALLGICNAEERLPEAEYRYPTKRNYSVSVKRVGVGFSVAVECDRLRATRPAVARAIQSTEAEQYLIVSMCQYLSVGRGQLSLSGLRLLEVDDRSDRFKAVYSIDSVALGETGERVSNERGSGDLSTGSAVPASVPSVPVVPVEVSKDLGGRLSKMPTRLSEVPQEVIGEAIGAARSLAGNWPRRLPRRGAVASITDLSKELDDVASHFESKIAADERIRLFDKPKTIKALGEAMEPFYTALGEIPFADE